MRELIVPKTVRMFQGEACRVSVKRNSEGSVEVIVALITLDGQFTTHTPEQFAAYVSDLAAVNERVQEAAREMLREPVKA